jgi:hypothetical protein
MANNEAPHNRRRDFLRKINLIGAISVSGSMLSPALALKANDKAGTVNFKEYANNVNPRPKIVVTKNSKLGSNNGPNLANLFCRLDISVTGNLKYLQVIGNGTETRFVQTVSFTENYVF